MAFERFTHSGRGFKPRASIRSSGQIGFNHGAIRRYRLGDYAVATLHYDRENRLVGIRPSNDREEDGAVGLRVRGTTAWISAKAFLDFYDIPYDRTRRFDLRWDEDERMLVIDLTKGVPTGSATRRSHGGV